MSCAAFLSSTAARCKVVALEPARLVAFSWQVGRRRAGITWTLKFYALSLRFLSARSGTNPGPTFHSLP